MTTLKTMTVGELIALLNEHPSDLPVTVSWEGQVKAVRPEYFTLCDHDGVKVLDLDADT